MIAKTNRRFPIYRIALLALALLLTGLGMLPTATAGCTYGQTRTIIVNIACCNYPYAWATKQNQVCCANGTWENNGSPYCGPVSACAI